MSPEWFEIIKKFETSNIPRIQQLEDQKISNAWKNENPILKDLYLEDLLYTHDCQMILSDESQIIICQCSLLYFFNARNLKLIKKVKFETVTALRFVINVNYLVVEVCENGFRKSESGSTLIKSLFIWKRFQACQGEPFKLPWVRQGSFNLSPGDILNRIILQEDGSQCVLLEKWNLATSSLQYSKVIKTDGIINKSRPIMDGSDDLLIASVEQIGEIGKLFYSRCSERGCLWKIEKNSFRWMDWNSDFLLLKLGTCLKIINFKNGKLEQTLDYSKKFQEIRSACIQGRRIAVNGLTVNLKKDIYIDDWKTGQALTKCSQMMNLDSNLDKLSFHLGNKQIIIRSGGKLDLVMLN